MSFINATITEQKKCTNNKISVLTNSGHVETLSDLDNFFGRGFDYFRYTTPYCTIKQL